MEWPVGLVCTKCKSMFGSVINPSDIKDIWQIKAICGMCIERLSNEKGITPNSPETWARLLE